MDAKQFIAEFGHIANAPGGVKRLREMVLELAISGKLLSFQPSEESSKSLLLRIEAHRKELITKGEMKRQKPLPEISRVELPFALPNQWEYQRLGLVCNIVRGITFPASRKEKAKTEDNVVCLRTANIQEEVDWSNLIYVDPSFTKRNDQWVEVGDTLISMANSYELVGKVSLVREVKYKSTFGGFISAVRPHLINPEYLFLLLRSPYMQYAMRATASQTTNIANISLAGMQPIPVPIPPLDEQARIVAKVDELMALCDQLEEQQQQKRKLQNQLRQATLQAVAAATSPFELKQHWQRLQDNFEQLFSAPEDVVEFKGLILDLAVGGKLLSPEQYTKDSTGSDLLAEIERARINWVENSFDQELKEAKTMLTKLRKQKVELPEEKLPEHWRWATFLQISMAVIDCHNKTAPYVDKGIHLVRTTDIRNGRMDLRNTKKITEETYAYWSRRMPPRAGDIFFTREAPMGEAAIVPEGEMVCLGQRTMLLRLFPELVNNEFLLYAIRSPSFQNRMVDAAIGMTVKHLRVGGVEDLFVPVPPKVEQDKIVDTLNHFFDLCEKYEKQLEKENLIAKNFATASIDTLTGINTPQEEEPLKAPKTELVAPVTLGPNKPNSKDAAPLASLLTRQNGQMNANDLWQRFGGEIDAFYAQLKTEVAHGWVAEPAEAKMLEKDAS